MSRKDDIAAALADHVRHQVEAAEHAANEETYKAARAGGLQSSSYLRSLAISYREAMRQAAETAGRLLAAFEGEAAANSAHLLDKALAVAVVNLNRAYEKRTRGGDGFGLMVNEAARMGAWLAEEIDLIASGTVRNLRLGAVGLESLRDAQRHALSIDARGGNANVQLGSPGASIAIGRDQLASSSIDIAALVAALDDVARKVGSADIAHEPRIDLLDQLDHASRIATSPDPDEGLLRRTVTRLVSPLQAVGYGVLGNALSKLVGL